MSDSVATTPNASSSTGASGCDKYQSDLDSVLTNVGALEVFHALQTGQALLTIVLNAGLLILLLVKIPNPYQRVLDAFIVNLALADLLIGVQCIFNSVLYYSNITEHMPWLQQVKYFSFKLVIYSSLALFLAFSILQYVAVYFPLRAKRLATPARIINASWALSITLALLMTMAVQLMRCRSTYYQLKVMELVLMGLACVVIVISHVIILVKFLRRTKDLQQLTYDLPTIATTGVETTTTSVPLTSSNTTGRIATTTASSGGGRITPGPSTPLSRLRPNSSTGSHTINPDPSSAEFYSELPSITASTQVRWSINEVARDVSTSSSNGGDDGVTGTTSRGAAKVMPSLVTTTSQIHLIIDAARKRLSRDSSTCSNAESAYSSTSNRHITGRQGSVKIITTVLIVSAMFIASFIPYMITYGHLIVTDQGNVLLRDYINGILIVLRALFDPIIHSVRHPLVNQFVVDKWVWVKGWVAQIRLKMTKHPQEISNPS